MPMQARFSIVLVNYKTPRMTAICLEQLQQIIAPFDADVWVVDNHSADESTELLRKLDWIKLIERHPEKPESGFVAHGLALDLVLAQIKTDYLFIMHTDTIIHDAGIFNLMLEACNADEGVAVVGCVDQIHRGKARTAWRVFKRFFKHHSRRVKMAFGMPSKLPRDYIEQYLKSFFALWDVRVMKQHGLTFSLGKKSPGYVAQDQLVSLGYKIKKIPASTIFRYLDHLQGGTKTFGLGSVNSRRLGKNTKMIDTLGARQPNSR